MTNRSDRVNKSTFKPILPNKIQSIHDII